jgi:hypothetical protein
VALCRDLKQNIPRMLGCINCTHLPKRCFLQQLVASTLRRGFGLTRTSEREYRASFLHGATVAQLFMQTSPTAFGPFDRPCAALMRQQKTTLHTDFMRTVAGPLSLPLSPVRTLISFCCTRSTSLPVRLLIFVGSPPFNLAVILPVAARVQACAAVPVPHLAPRCSPSRRRQHPWGPHPWGPPHHQATAGCRRPAAPRPAAVSFC